MTNTLDCLIIAPHPDDAELGMGGTISKLIHQGRRVGILDLTNGEPTPFGSPEIRAAETSAASQILKLTWRQNLGLVNRQLQPTLEARAALAGVFRQTRPRWIFAPFWVDAHPDHVAATELIEAARFWSKLTKTDLPGTPYHPERVYYYYCVHLKMHPVPAFVVDITDQWIQKRDSIASYASQFIVGREHDSPSFLERMESQASYWGQMIGVRYGEPFASREPIGLTNLDSLR